MKRDMQPETPINIKELFSDSSFAIPPYQRAYSWDEKHLSQFITDIEEQPKNKNYFLGHFLFEQDEINKDTYWIIDGQQRLTTVVIFFSCMFDVLSKRDDLPKDFKVIDEIGFYLCKDTIIKLKTVHYDNNFFEKYIIDREEICETCDTSSQLRISNAKTFFTKKLKRPTDEIIKLKTTLQDAHITTFVVRSKEQAAQIFEFQNNRGKDLTNVEKLKAFFIYQIYLNSQTFKDDIKFIEKEFEAIYKLTEKIEMFEDDVLNYYCKAFYFGYHNEDIIKKN